MSDCRSGHESVAQRCKCKEGFETKNEVCVKGNVCDIVNGGDIHACKGGVVMLL